MASYSHSINKFLSKENRKKEKDKAEEKPEWKGKSLSKSKYLNGLQCVKLLWTESNAKERIPEPDESQQHRFDEGKVVGDYAKKLFPGGIDIPTEPFKENLDKTQELVKLKKPLFEAAFSPKGERIYSRADILDPQKDGSWNIIEVKSATKVENVNISDVAFQKYVYEKAGLKINKCFVMHINNEYVRKGELEIEKLFAKEDVTEKVEEEIKLVPNRIKEMLKIIDGKEPKMQIGSICRNPYECAMKEVCWAFLPKNSVMDLYRGGKFAEKLLEEGIVAIKDIPEEYKVSDKQRVQMWCEKNKKPHVNKENITEFIKKLKYPLYFLDFETFQTTIPIYDNQRPYQQIPFQFSLYILEKEQDWKDINKKAVHKEYLAKDSKDPRKEFLNELKKVLGKKGSIIVYSQSFEQGRLEELGELFPEEQKAITSIIKRMADLILPFRNFDFYECEQQGSASIKDVLPALTGNSVSYDKSSMNITNGGEASLNFFYSTHGLNSKLPSPEEIEQIRKDLLEYCGLDTWGMVLILNRLKKEGG